MKWLLFIPALVVAMSLPAQSAVTTYPITVVNPPESHLQYLDGYLIGSHDIVSFCFDLTIPDGTKIDGVRAQVQFLKFDGTPIKLAKPITTEADDVVLKPETGWPATGVFRSCFFGTNGLRNLGIEPSKGVTMIVTSIHRPETKPWIDLPPADHATPTTTLPMQWATPAP